MQANISVYPIVQRHRIDKSGRMAINLVVDLDNKHVAYDALGEKAPKILPGEWDEAERRVKRSNPNAAAINHVIQCRRTELEGIFLQWELKGGTLTKKLIKQLVAGEDPGRSFIAFCRKQIQDKYDSKETIRTYESEVTKMLDFRGEASFRDVDFTYLQEYAAWMRDTRGNKPNTIWKTFKFMNTMMNDAIKTGGIIKVSPFEKFDRGRYKQTPRTFLRKSERELLEKKMAEAMPLIYQQVLAYFLFMTYCGLRYEDAMSFSYAEHVVDDERIIMETQKKDYQVNIKLYPKLREAMTFIVQNPLPPMGNRAFNKYLQPIVYGAGIEDKHVTAHVGRHSFGRLLAERGVDKEHAQKLLGHHCRSSTDIYYHTLDEDLDKSVDDKLASL